VKKCGRLLDVSGMSAEEVVATGVESSVHPRVKDQKALRPSHIEKCVQCGEEIWVAERYPPGAKRYCGYCVFPKLTGEHKEQMRKLLNLPAEGEMVH
jgi:hypothetical protein